MSSLSWDGTVGIHSAHQPSTAPFSPARPRGAETPRRPQVYARSASTKTDRVAPRLRYCHPVTS